jgi:ABC-type Zn uptake system ZnuABC Zn-binding protein ZnuA
MRAVAIASLLLLAPLASRGADPITVLTSLQSTWSLASALADGTAIGVINVMPARVRMERHGAQFEKDAADFAAQARAAAAVLTIRSAWPADPLFAHARHANIRVVEIDAATPFDPAMTGVARLQRQRGGLLPHVWLSPDNGMRMAEIIAADFRRLSPADARRIDANLDRVKRALFDVKRFGDACLAESAVPALVLLTDEFDYFTEAFNIEIVERMLEPEDRWQPADYEQLAAILQASGVTVVAGKWQPGAPMLDAIRAGGGSFVQLDTLDPAPQDTQGAIGVDAYRDGLQRNIERVCAALAGAREPQEGSRK